MNELKTAENILAVSGNDRSYIVYGNQIRFSIAQINYCKFLKKFDEINHDAIVQLKKSFDSWGSLEGLYNQWHVGVKEIYFDCILNLSVQYIQSLGIYEWDVNRLADYCDTCAYTFGDVFAEHYLEKYLDIVGDKDAVIEYRRNRKQYRRKSVGIGFGLGGQIKASVKAGAINAATGVGHSMVNMVGNTASRIGANVQMSSVYHDKDSYKKLEKACTDMVYSVAEKVKKLINENSSIKICSFKSEDIKKARALFESLQGGVVEKERRKEVICSILQNNPLHQNTYILALEEYGDSENGLKEMAKDFSVDLVKYANELMNRKYASVLKTKYSNEVELLETKDNIINMAKFYGISSKNQYIEYLDKAWEELDRKMRTVNGIEMPTREEAVYYVKDTERLENYMSNINYEALNLLDADNIQLLIQKAKELEFSGNYIPQLIEERLMDTIKPFKEKQEIEKRISQAINKVAETRNIIILSSCYKEIERRIAFEFGNNEKLKMFVGYLQNKEELVFVQDCSIMNTWNTGLFVTNMKIVFVNKDRIIAVFFGDIDRICVSEKRLNVVMKNGQNVQSDLLRGLSDEYYKEWGTLVCNIIQALKKAYVEYETVFCTQCGARIVKTVNFCNVCGSVNKYKGGNESEM